MTTAPANHPLAADWSPADSAKLYGIDSWGQGLFRVSDRGTVHVTPQGEQGPSIDLRDVVAGLADRGYSAPLLLRFTDVLDVRLRAIKDAFDQAIEKEAFEGSFRAVFPIKVNQQRHIVEEIRDFGAGLGFGLEAGSKPELLAVLGLTAHTAATAKMPIICNGFKDAEYIETVTLARKLGRDITPVVEQPRELDLILEAAERHGIKPVFGVRTKPSAKGSGKWQESGGTKSKFGLTPAELIEAVEKLKDQDKLAGLKLVHFHIGSQICDIRSVSAAVDEITNVYCELRRLGASSLTRLDVGGGMGVDYDGSQTAWDSSANYSLSDYALDVVHRVRSVCDQAGQPHPELITECGRAMSAFSSVLIMETVGRSGDRPPPPLDAMKTLVEEDADPPRPFIDLFEAFEDAHAPHASAEMVQLYTDATRAHAECQSLFGLGYLSLTRRAGADQMARAVGRRALAVLEADPEVSEEDVRSLGDELAETCFVNASVFQSLPDLWAVDQVFPVCPIHRLDERPDRRSVLGDMTCDSDGRIDLFSDPGRREPKNTIELHGPGADALGAVGENPGLPYTLGVFLVGAYQEVLGDLHNLFGDTHAVHVRLDGDDWNIEEIVEGDSVREVLGYVQYDCELLRKSLRTDIERATRAGSMSAREGQSLMAFYAAGLDGYTYLES